MTFMFGSNDRFDNGMVVKALKVTVVGKTLLL